MFLAHAQCKSAQPFKEDSSPKNNEVVLTYFFPIFATHHFQDGGFVDLFPDPCTHFHRDKENGKAMQQDIL